MNCQRVCILGVGLLGGSIGLRLRRDRLVQEVIGFGRDPKKIDDAIRLGAIDRGSDRCEIAAREADLVIACTPVQQIARSLTTAALTAKPTCLFTDVGSTKKRIVVGLRDAPFQSRFVGSHPIAGSDKSGAEFATADLFEGRLVILTPESITSSTTLDGIGEFWRKLGAKTAVMTPDDHDEAIALTSHLPHLLASILAMATPENLLEMTGTGWSDTTRVAAGNPQLWRQIIEENHGPVLHAVKNFATISREWIEAIEAKDFERVEQLLTAGKVIRDIVGNRYTSG